jgi:diguanylate cyclase (GGDEF)-like protein
VAKTKRILLIDDEPDILTVTRTSLEVMGDFSVISSSSATEALANLEKFYPDLIMVDVMMPELDGISFVRRLKTMSRFSHIPVVFLTARTQPDDVERYRGEGAVDVISKPFAPEELVQKLNRVLPAEPPAGQAADELAAKLLSLRQAFRDQLPSKLRDIEKLWQVILEEGENWQNLYQFYRLTHNLTGSGATFGYNTLSIIARILENFLHPFIESKRFPDPAQKADLTDIVAQLHEAAVGQEDESATGASSAPLSKIRRSDRLVYLLEERTEQRAEMVRQLEFFGYEVLGLSGLAALKTAMGERLPSVLVTNTSLDGQATAGILAVSEMAQYSAVPLVFIADREDLETHLAALRGGGRAFFVRPFDLGDLVDRIDLLTGQQAHDPYRVLIVEDDAQLAAYYELTLERAGMKCLVVTDALQVLGPIRAFRPDLILLDIYLGACSGLELAAMLRQRESLVGIAIVFLSTEMAIETQSAGIALGAEDYLTKPIQAEHLVSVLVPRLERSRILRDIMDTDGLTGLLNHTKIKEHLEVQLAQQGKRLPFCFAMIDVDHFKKVNDTYGHAEGDRVLKGLARLLKQRLRRSDVIGRYGGEEFAVILPETSLEEAREVFDRIRESFGSVTNVSGTAEFQVTFSGGLAAWPDFKDVVSLSDAADAALYEAKSSGRNRLVVKTAPVAQGVR